MTDLPSGPEELRELLRGLLGTKADGCDRNPKPDAYLFTLSRCWDRMEMLVGPMGARAILDHSISLAAKQHPWVTRLAVEDASPGPPGLGMDRSLADQQELCSGLEQLCVKLLQTLVELTGNVVVGPVLAELGQRQDPQ